MPNLRGTSMVGRDEGGRSYTARMVSRDRPSRRHHGSVGSARGGDRGRVQGTTRWAHKDDRRDTRG